MNMAKCTEHEEILEGDSHHPQITSPTEWQTFNRSPRKPRNYSNNLRMDDYTHAQVVYYAMMQYSLRKVINRSKQVGEVEVEKYLKQLHKKITFASMNSSDMSEQKK